MIWFNGFMILWNLFWAFFMGSSYAILHLGLTFVHVFLLGHAYNRYKEYSDRD